MRTKMTYFLKYLQKSHDEPKGYSCMLRKKFREQKLSNFWRLCFRAARTKEMLAQGNLWGCLKAHFLACHFYKSSLFTMSFTVGLLKIHFKKYPLRQQQASLAEIVMYPKSVTVLILKDINRRRQFVFFRMSEVLRSRVHNHLLR